jgi:hypothetical protein
MRTEEMADCSTRLLLLPRWALPFPRWQMLRMLGNEAGNDVSRRQRHALRATIHVQVGLIRMRMLRATMLRLAVYATLACCAV